MQKGLLPSSRSKHREYILVYMNKQYHVLADQKVIGTCSIDRLSVSNFSHIDSLAAKVSKVHSGR